MSCVLLSAPTVEAQRLPGDTGAPTSAEQGAIFHQEIRRQLTQTLQEWVNVWEREQPETMARYYTDEALLLTAGGAALGRHAIGTMWQERMPTVSDVRVEIAEVLPASSLAAATGRVSYRISPPDGPSYQDSEQFLMVFDDHRGHWMIRAQAFAPSTGSAGGREVIRANRRAARPPEKVTVRLVGEAFGGRSGSSGLPEAATWDVLGGGFGLELGRLFEFRGQAWQEMGAGIGEEPLRNYSGELRVHFARIWRVWPNVSVGAGRITGTATPDEEVIPVLGAGLGIAINDALRVQIGARNYLPQKPTTDDRQWFSAPRNQRWIFSGGLSFAVGRDRAWNDPPRTPMQLEYEASFRPGVARAMEEWFTALESADPQALQRTYALGAVLLVPGEQTHRTPDAIQRYWRENGRQFGDLGVEVNDLRISGDVALVTIRLASGASQPAADAGHLVTVFERSNGHWKIRAQALAAPTANASLPDTSME